MALAASMFAQEAGTMVKVEKLSPSEITKLRAAEDRVREAQAALNAVKVKIEEAHDMKSERWMEWSTSCEFDGDFVVLRYQNHMRGISFASVTERMN